MHGDEATEAVSRSILFMLLVQILIMLINMITIPGPVLIVSSTKWSLITPHSLIPYILTAMEALERYLEISKIAFPE